MNGLCNHNTPILGVARSRVGVLARGKFMKIVTDSSIMYSIAEGAERGIEVLPLSVAIEGETWLEYEDISAAQFIEKVREGGVPTSSCPPVGMALAAYDTDEDVVHIAMADGLSGAYGVAAGLVEQARHPERVHVINSKTLCVPHRIMALAAVEMKKAGATTAEIVEAMRAMAETSRSYLVPEDFDFLRRGGRLTPMAAKFAHMLKAVPVMRQTEDGKRIESLKITRSLKKGLAAIMKDLEERGVREGFYISVSHADNLPAAQQAIEAIKAHFPQCGCGIFNLGPAFITQGGPGCFAIQAIDMTLCPQLQLS